jgi:hypothetical protein
MNEDQKHNDHRLHIEPCKCGNPHPVVSGDDFDADIYCEKCYRITPNCYGTRGAIKYWNENRLNIEEKLFPIHNAI